MNEKEQQLLDLFPQNYLSSIKSVSLVKLKTKYTINGTKIQTAYNLIVNIGSSAFYPSGKSIILCKLCDDILFLPETGEYSYVSDLKKSRFLLEKSIKSSCCSGSFGCCSKYNECSNVKFCVHENPFYSLGCIYRTHLENGEIFYAPDKNT